ncbi:MAG: hypothetical protein PWR32_597 [Candidatus Woesearchaeota archaeon]|nr:hypothetical protein [Candidatus Woesearchaeota archaeon]
MTTRRIQKVGGSTYIVSLPKAWVVKNNLKEKDLINITIKDKNLILSPEKLNLLFPDTIELSLDEHENSIIQILYSLYYLGVSEIRIVSKKPFSVNVLNKLGDFVNSLNGAELIYEDSKRVIISFFVSVKKLSRYQLFMRFLMILKRMIVIFFDDPNNTQKILSLEQDSDKIFHLFNRWYFEANSGKIVEDSVVLELLPFYLRIVFRLEKLIDVLSELLTDKSFTQREILEEVKPVFDFLLDRINVYLELLSEQSFDNKRVAFEADKYEAQKEFIKRLPNRFQSFVLREILGFCEANEKDVISILKLMSFLKEKNKDVNVDEEN